LEEKGLKMNMDRKRMNSHKDRSNKIKQFMKILLY
jgi:hypothetical protein